MDPSIPIRGYEHWIWWVVVLAGILTGVWILWANKYMANGDQGWPQLSWEVYPSTEGEEEEALACVLSEPERFQSQIDVWLERTRVKAGRAALRAEMKRRGIQ